MLILTVKMIERSCFCAKMFAISCIGKTQRFSQKYVFPCCNHKKDLFTDVFYYCIFVLLVIKKTNWRSELHEVSILAVSRFQNYMEGGSEYFYDACPFPFVLGNACACQMAPYIFKTILFFINILFNNMGEIFCITIYTYIGIRKEVPIRDNTSVG